MDAIQEIIEALEEWQREAERIVIEEAKDFEAEIIDYNTETQLYAKGQLADGTKVEPPYSPVTEYIKQLKGQPTDRVTLRDTGDFHRSFSIEWRNTEFEIFATDGKTGKLIRAYGKEIFGLDEIGLQELREDLKEPLIDRFRKQVTT